MTSTLDSRRGTIVLLQAMRGWAAMLVLLGHIDEQLVSVVRKSGGDPWPRISFPGGFGVDLFFCISGFIMVVTTARSAGQPGAAGEFLARRAIRLVPLYWLATILYLLVLAASARGLPQDPGVALVSSLLFWPFPVQQLQDGMVFPLLSLGWSLNYEVLFYLLFSMALALPVTRAVAATGAMLLVLVGLGAMFRPDALALRFWTQPIVLEFGAGMLAGLAWVRGLRLRLPVALALAASVVLWLCIDPFDLMQHLPGHSTPNGVIRLAGWGLPAAVLLVALTALERGNGERVQRWPLKPFVRLGDWSYSLYLFHPFALLALTRAWLMLKPELRPSLPSLAVAFVVGSVLLAAAVDRCADRPMNSWLSRQWRDRDAWRRAPPKPREPLP